MNWKRLKRKPIAQVCAAALIAGGVIATSSTLYAATLAGTEIKNLATVTYQDAVGNVYSAQSNEAVVTVAQVYSATMGVDVDASAAAGQTVYLPFVITNTGNGTDIFDLTAVNNISILDDIDSSSITIYEDTNGSGEPEAGEPVITSASILANGTGTGVSGSGILNVVVAVQVPANATPGQTLGVTLTAEAQNGTGVAVADSVTDLTATGGRDGDDSTNESLITVTNNAVLVTTKTAVHDAINNTISYTVTVRNNGNQPASNVVLFDGLPAGTTLLTSGVSGILLSNGDQVDTADILSETGLTLDLNGDGDTTDSDEIDLNLDLNNDGDSSDANVNGIYAIDSELPQNTSVSLTFTVSYDPTLLGGGYVIENQGHASGDTDGDTFSDSLASSAVIQTVVQPAFGVAISDTGAAAANGVNDGGDDDGLINNDQLVDEAAAGGSVVFTSTISNTGNSADIFELSVDPANNFPAGTIFTFFDQSGLVQLTDTNGSGVDSGVVLPSSNRTIIVKATLPASASGDAPLPATEYQALIVATSANDPSASPASDTTNISLGTIIVAVADIHNAQDGAIGSNEDPLTIPYTAVNTYVGQTGTTVNIPLYIDNENGGSDSFVLSAGSSFDGTTLSGLPAGWSVEFYVGDGSGGITGSSLSSTPVIPGGAVNFEVIAVVSIPSDSTQAVNSLVFDNNGDAVDDTLDGNGDGDGDYPIFFQISSLNTGASDIKLDAVDVNANRQISLVTPGSNQVEPGGSTSYGHILANNGNVNEVVEISSSNNQPSWTHTLSIDTNGDGIVDTDLSNLIPGAITVQQANGVDIVVTVTDVDTDGFPELTLQPGFSIPLSANVYAPSNAANGQVDSLTITASNTDPAPTAPSASLVDQTTVTESQVRLNKTVAVDVLCDGSPDTAFAAVQVTGVKPGECAIWQVQAENQGSTNALNVKISDAVTAYSTYEANSLEYCLSANCLLDPMTELLDTDAGSISGNNIVFYVGTGADPVNDLGGLLIPGEIATARFRVRVQ